MTKNEEKLLKAGFKRRGRKHSPYYEKYVKNINGLKILYYAELDNRFYGLITEFSSSSFKEIKRFTSVDKMLDSLKMFNFTY